MRFILLAVALVTLAGCDSKGVDKKTWLDGFRPLLVEKACKDPSTYFRQCFDVDEAGSGGLNRQQR